MYKSFFFFGFQSLFLWIQGLRVSDVQKGFFNLQSFQQSIFITPVWVGDKRQQW